MQPELASMQSTPIFLECLRFEKLTAGRMDGETDQKNLIWLPSFSRLWGRFKVSFCVSHLAYGQCKLWEWTVPLSNRPRPLRESDWLILQGLVRHQHLISKAMMNCPRVQRNSSSKGCCLLSTYYMPHCRRTEHSFNFPEQLMR